ncbi:hypothetical protein [Streptococcus merionis]|uniref:hypothetical protein n=1 Tax=Streptococcus merionis TaxID=400065 RepID=UPI003517C853
MVKKFNFGKALFSLLLLFCIFGCEKRAESPFESHNTFEKSSNVPLEIQQIPADDLLGASDTLSYPQNYSFIPTFLGDDGVAYGYSEDQKSLSISLIALDTSSNKYTNLYSVNKESAPITLGVYYADSDFVLINEYHYASSESKYLVLEKETGQARKILSFENVPPLHLTEADRYADAFYINTSDSSGNYLIYEYHLTTGSVEIIESENSGFPTIYKDDLFYIQFDNLNTKSKLLKYSIKAKEKVVIATTTQKEEFFNGLYSNGEEFILFRQVGDSIEVERGDIDHLTPFIKVNSAELPVYSRHYFSFIGTPKDGDGRRMRSQLYDVEKNIEYMYDDSVLYLSQSGILWVEYLKAESEIETGQIFKKENSVIRYFSFN